MEISAGSSHATAYLYRVEYKVSMVRRMCSSLISAFVKLTDKARNKPQVQPPTPDHVYTSIEDLYQTISNLIPVGTVHQMQSRKTCSGAARG